MLKTALFSCLFFFALVCQGQTKPYALPVAFGKGWHIKTQFAGSIGFISIGAGHSGRRLEADAWYGYVPKALGAVPIHTLTGKLTWFPIKPIQFRSAAIRPLSVGSFMSYTAGDQYFLFDPDKYPFDYYGYPTALRIGLFAGGQLTLHPTRNSTLGKWAVYYEIGTTDLRLASYFTNMRALSPTDLFTLGLGVKRHL